MGEYLNLNISKLQVHGRDIRMKDMILHASAAVCLLLFPSVSLYSCSLVYNAYLFLIQQNIPYPTKSLNEWAKHVPV